MAGRRGRRFVCGNRKPAAEGSAIAALRRRATTALRPGAVSRSSAWIPSFARIPATYIASFWAFLLGVCIIAAGLTFLETIANPYTTVLGPLEFAATRINLAQSCNGIGLLLGPIAGGIFFYSKNAEGVSTGAEQMWIPYAAIGVVVLTLFQV